MLRTEHLHNIIKRFCLLLLCVCLLLSVACADKPNDAAQAGETESTDGSGKTDESSHVQLTSENSLLKDALSKDTETLYKTAVVDYGTFVRSCIADCSLLYANVQTAYHTMTDAKVYLDSFFVERYAYVEEGDLIARLYTSVDDITVEELTLQLARDEANWASEKTLVLQALAEQEAAINAISDQYERQSAQLTYTLEYAEQEAYIAKREQAIQALADELEAYLSLPETIDVTAPVSGFVYHMGRYYHGSSVSAYSELATIYSTDTIYLTVQNPANLFQYNSKVSIAWSNGTVNETLTGTVISAESVLPDSLSSDVSVIRLDQKPPVIDYGNLISITATAILRSEPNCLLVQKNAVSLDGEATYVTILENGTTHKRYIVTIDNNTDYYWVYEGLVAGQQVILH